MNANILLKSFVYVLNISSSEVRSSRTARDFVGIFSHCRNRGFAHVQKILAGLFYLPGGYDHFQVESERFLTFLRPFSDFFTSTPFRLGDEDEEDDPHENEEQRGDGANNNTNDDVDESDDDSGSSEDDRGHQTD